MKIEINNAEAVAEIKELMARFGISAETVVERIIIEAGCWMPMETLANSYWKDRKPAEIAAKIPSWHGLVRKLPVFTKDWNLKIINDPPHFELAHLSGFMVSLSIYDRESPLWMNERGLLLRLGELRCGPTISAPAGFSKTPSQRQSLIAQARKIVAEIDPLTIIVGLEKDILYKHIEANRAEYPR
jgi:hypothetical protein